MKLITIVFICVILIFVHLGLPYIYTPSALTKKKLKVYKECIKFFEKFPQYKEMTLLTHSDVIVGNDSRLFADSPEYQEGKIKKYFTGEEIKKIVELSFSLKQVKCIKAVKKSKVILFYIYEGGNFIFPSPSGVLYSLSEKDPNKIDDIEIKEYRPYVNIVDQWYYSRNLILSRGRHTTKISIPKSLFDFSSHIPKE